MNIHCPLCHNEKLNTDYHKDRFRSYYQCLVCFLVFVPKEQHLSKEKEKAIYDLHENSLNDQGYINFLQRFCLPFSEKLLDENGLPQNNLRGLDFGCGPAPVLAMLLQKQGFKIDFYDPFYYPNASLLEKKYDFITCTEVIEHVSDARALVAQFDTLLSTKGILGIMTKRVIDQTAFRRWHYKNDMTHICFYSLATFSWLAQNMSWQLEIITDDVVFFLRS